MHTFDSVINELKAKRIGGGKYQAKCPAHDDKCASLTISSGKDGNGDDKLLLFCHAGCGFTSIINALPKNHNSNNQSVIQMNETTPSPSQLLKSTTKKPNKPPQLVATYDYTDQDGVVRFQVLRYEPKTFKQRRAIKGGFKWGLEDIQRYPYRLPGFIHSDYVVIVEGEKDADALIDMGFPATTFAGGAGKWRDEYLEWFTGKNVYIIPDNDDAGYKGANIIAEKLQGAGKEIKFVTWDLNKPKKYDTSDWIADGGTASEFQKLLDVSCETLGECGADGAVVTEIKTPLTNWRSKLIVKTDKHGNEIVQSRKHNAMVFLENHDELKGCFAYNEFTSEVEKIKGVPWDMSSESRPTTDDDAVRLCAWLENHNVNLDINTMHKLIDTASKEYAFHPLKDWLNGLEWDGQKRVDNLLIRHAGVPASDYVRCVTRKWLVGAVKRALLPGCKMDYMIIFEGEQGLNKSTFFRALFGDEYFSDTMPDFNNFKDAMQFLRGVWCVEIPELDSFNRAETDTIKRFLTVQEDRYRPAYGAKNIKVGRSCVFAGTVNPIGNGYLTDATGARRFWPVSVGRFINETWIRENRDQIWAEVMHFYKAGEKNWLEGDQVEWAKEEQQYRSEADVLEPKIAEYVKDFNGSKYGFTLYDCMTSHKGLGWASEKCTKASQMRVSKILKKLGYTRKRPTMPNGKREYRWLSE